MKMSAYHGILEARRMIHPKLSGKGSKKREKHYMHFKLRDKLTTHFYNCEKDYLSNLEFLRFQKYTIKSHGKVAKQPTLKMMEMK